ncbi:hypothetical protein [Acetobacter cibinongensis]|uniref:hypothetical protein n=1 Tax=Acetobacter cibinongensis TaxID=146475 RepID=UPI000A3CA269|nr:hypothetical protein [Acetobacter cibinongensis]
MAKRPAQSSTFAHLSKANRASEDEDDKNKASADGEDTEDDDEEKKKEEEAKAAKAKKAKAKKAEAEDGEDTEGDDDTDEEDEKDSTAKSARARERARCATIFQSPSAAHNLAAAAHLAFNTAMPRTQAVGLLEQLTPTANHQAPASKPTNTLRARMSNEPFKGVALDDKEATSAKRPGAVLVAAQSARHGGK